MSTLITVGRIVHYTTVDGVVEPAIITGVVPRDGIEAYEENDHVVSLKVFPVTGFNDIPEAAFTDAKPGMDEARGKWSWPSLEPEAPAKKRAHVSGKAK